MNPNSWKDRSPNLSLLSLQVGILLLFTKGGSVNKLDLVVLVVNPRSNVLRHAYERSSRCWSRYYYSRDSEFDSDRNRGIGNTYLATTVDIQGNTSTASHTCVVSAYRIFRASVGGWTKKDTAVIINAGRVPVTMSARSHNAVKDESREKERERESERETHK